MELFDSRTTKWILWLVIPLLFLPKINLIGGFSGQTAGVRIDDLVLFSFSFLFFWAKVATRQPFSLFEKLIGAFTLVLLLSYLLNAVWVFFDYLMVKAHLVYALRLFEYFLFFYIGMYAVRHYNYRKVLISLTLVCVSVMVLQKAGLIGAFTTAGYRHTQAISYRILGICSFPSEAGAMLNVLSAFWLFDSKLKEQFLSSSFFDRRKREMEFLYPFFVIALFGLLIIWSGSRIALLAHLLLSFLALKNSVTGEKKKLIYFFSLLVGAIALGAAAYATGSILSRSIHLLSFENLSIIGAVWDRVATHYIPIGKEQVTNTFADASWMIRIHKWCYALKIYVQHPECYLTGIGPGFAMAALDGGFLRLLVEGGIAGLAIFLLFLKKAASTSPQIFAAVIAFCLNMVFFDVYLAYKVMSLLFFALGAVYAEAAIKGQVHYGENKSGLVIGSLRV